MDLDDYINPIWANTYWVRQAIGMYEAIGNKAKLVNAGNQGHFWAVSQQFALNYLAVALYKIYENNKKHEIHSIPQAYERLRQFVYKNGLPDSLQETTLVNIGFSKQQAQKICKIDSKNKPNLDKDFLDIIKRNIPNPSSSSALKKLQNFRNTIGAHQKVLADGANKNLPSIEKMERLNLWAESFCQFIAECNGKRALGKHSTPCGRTMTLNVMKKSLGLKFDTKTEKGWSEYQKFYAKND